MKLTTHSFTDRKYAQDFLDQMLERGFAAWFVGGGLSVVVRAWDL